MTLWTVAEVSRRLRVKPGTIYAAIRSGALKCYRFGSKRGALRISEENLLDFVHRSEVSVDTLDREVDSLIRRLRKPPAA